MTARLVHGWRFLALAAVAACEDPPRSAPRSDASVAPAPPPPPQREGCARSGSFEALETDPSCVVKRSNEDAMRAALKQIAITLEAEPGEVVAGGASLLTLTIRNTSASEVTLFLEARPRPPGPRTDWSRVVGIPEPRPGGGDVPRLLFPLVTSDEGGRDVDALPTVSGSAALAPTPEPTILAVHLRPGAKLTRTLSWWALRIPAPAPIVTLDGGHRYVPKTTAFNLLPGDYTVTIDLPLSALGREERKLTTRLRVTRAPLPDGGFRRSF
jgi:hypothetical protein